MTALNRTCTFWAAVCLLATAALAGACGTDAPPPTTAPEATVTAQSAASPKPSASAEPPVLATAAPTHQPTAEPDFFASATATPTSSAPLPTAPPTTAQPTARPTAPPNAQPTTAPPPTAQPTAQITVEPTAGPTAQSPTPTPEPTPKTTPEPTAAATPSPSWSGALSYQVLATYPHDTSAFTQGLLWFDGLVYESTGLRGQSVLRIVDLPTGRVLQETPGDPQHFGEGLALVDDQLIWLTWQAGTATVHHQDTLEQTGSFTYSGEGWGLCHDGARLVMSDGSSTLTFRHPETFEVLGSVPVTRADGSPVNRLNELECIGDDVWANVWLTDRIVVIDPDTGTVIAEADMAGIINPHPELADSNNVLNGIAYRPDTGTFLITGKRWPTVFEVRFE
ncbi:glutaminyl-peptide cyclotransferase [Candidatus Poriferisocius sp.]|uniref:glutaminyl-peptide cyclotransferase n=1 Tax=Candidatus Poriferisocius sp. TaxID=3101276 RepID=UPI003B010E6C